MKIKNIGAARYAAGVELQPPGTDGIITVGLGEVADVPDAYGKQLCKEQPDSFEAVIATGKKGGGG